MYVFKTISMIKLIKQTLVAVSCFTFSFAFSQEVSITNNLPATATAGQAFDAEYTLTKGANMGSFAKFQLDLPAGFDAQSVDIKGGNFTFENNRVKIVWVSLPGDASFKFVFKLTASASTSGNITIAPQFFYLENNVKKEYVVPTSGINFGGSNGDIASGNNGSTPPPVTDNNNTSSGTAPDNTAVTPPANNTDNTQAPVTENTPPPAVNNTPPPVVNNTPPPVVKNTPPPAAKSNTVFHVQVAALTNKPTKTKFSEYGNVKIVEDAGLFKVLVGNFKTLEEARAYKAQLISKGASGCFVVAYENGVRIKI